MVGCKKCSSNLRFDISIQKLRCNFCKAFYELDDAKEIWMLEENEKKTEEEKKECMEVYVFRCQFCGGLWYGDRQDMGGGFCRYCGISAGAEERMVTIPRPKRVILFQKSKNDSKRILQGMLRKVLYLPDEYRDKEHVESMKPIYVPYRVVPKEEAAADGKDGGNNGGFGSLAHAESAMFQDEICDAVGNFSAGEGIDFEPVYMTDFYLDVDVPVSEDRAVTELLPEGKKQIRKGEDNILCPVWFLSYGDGERAAYAAINGQTGKIKANLPVDFNKFLCLSILALFPFYYLLKNITFLAQSFFVLTLSGMGAVFGVYLLCLQAKKILLREGVEAEAGVQRKKQGERSVKKKEEAPQGRAPFKWRRRGIFGGMLLWGGAGVFMEFFLPEIAGVSLAVFFLLLWCLQCYFRKKFVQSKRALQRAGISLRGARSGGICLPALLAGAAVFLFHPMVDAWYYGVGLVLLGGAIFEFLAYMRNYNFLVTKKIVPQGQKGGGSRG